MQEQAECTTKPNARHSVRHDQARGTTKLADGRAGRRAAEHVFMFGEQCSGAALQEKPKMDARMENIFIVELP